MSKLTIAATAALMISGSTFAFAQSAENSYYYGAQVSAPDSNEFFVRNRYTAADARFYEGLDPIPVRAGAFEARPVLRVGARSESNVFLDDVNEESDTVLVIAPSISAASTWSRHRIGFDAIAEHEEYLDVGDESATQFGARAFGQLDISSNFAVAGSVSHQNGRRERSSIGGVIDSAERVEFDRDSFEVNAAYAQNRLRLRGRVSVDDIDFSDVDSLLGGTIDQDFLDRETTRVSASAEYAVSRDWSLIGEVEQVERDFNQMVGDPLDRDIDGFIYRAGASFELPVNLRGRVSAELQDFDPADPTLDDVEQFGVNADVRWFPTELTTANFYVSQSVGDAGATGEANTLATRYGVGVDHELLRTLVLSGDTYFETREFNPSTREDDLTVFDIGATWKMNRNVQIRGGYRFISQDSNVDEFDDNVLSVAIRFFP